MQWCLMPALTLTTPFPAPISVPEGESSDPLHRSGAACLQGGDPSPIVRLDAPVDRLLKMDWMSHPASAFPPVLLGKPIFGPVGGSDATECPEMAGLTTFGTPF